eukprot:6314441-Pyramimonas_sp.AAC.1
MASADFARRRDSAGARDLACHVSSRAAAMLGAERAGAAGLFLGGHQAQPQPDPGTAQRRQ